MCSIAPLRLVRRSPIEKVFPIALALQNFAQLGADR
jgi:hypothetical protein